MMMKIYPLLSILLVAALMFSGCFTPQPIVRVAPEASENVFWHQGQAIAEQKIDSIVGRAAYSHVNRDYLVFDVEFFNETSSPMLIDPAMFYLRTPANFQSRAVDPERIIFSMEMDASRQEARAKNLAIAGGVVVVAAAVAVATSDDGDGDNNDYVDNYTTADAIIDVADGVGMIAWGLTFHQDPILSVSPNVFPETNDVLFWQEVALRKTTLMPDQNIRGLVAFPRLDDNNAFSLIAPIEEKRFDFLFEQQLYRP